MTEGQMITITTGIEVNYIAGSTREDTFEVPEADWAQRTPAERREYLNQAAEDFASNHVGYWASASDNDRYPIEGEE